MKASNERHINRGNPIARLYEAAERAKDEGDAIQATKFSQAALNLVTYQDENAYEKHVANAGGAKRSNLR